MKIKNVSVSVHRFENSIPLINRRLEDDFRVICEIETADATPDSA